MGRKREEVVEEGERGEGVEREGDGPLGEDGGGAEVVARTSTGGSHGDGSSSLPEQVQSLRGANGRTRSGVACRLTVVEMERAPVNPKILRSRTLLEIS